MAYLREWRAFRQMTQQQVVEALASLEVEGVPLTAASLSRIESEKQPYSQPILESLAIVYGTTPGQILDQDPYASRDLPQVLQLLKDDQKSQLLAVAAALFPDQTR